MVNDVIADMLTRMRNANSMKYKTVEVPLSKMTQGIADILAKEGFILGYKIEGKKPKKILLLNLKYGTRKERVISGLRRISKPSLRVYVKSNEIPKVLNGLGIAIVSTSKGLMTDKEARKQNLGGEILAYIW